MYKVQLCPLLFCRYATNYTGALSDCWADQRYTNLYRLNYLLKAFAVSSLFCSLNFIRQNVLLRPNLVIRTNLIYCKWGFDDGTGHASAPAFIMHLIVSKSLLQQTNYCSAVRFGSQSGSVLKGRQAGKTWGTIVQRGFVKVTRTRHAYVVLVCLHMCVHIHADAHTSQALRRQTVRGKNTEIKCCVLAVFHLACWQPSNSPVVTLDNFAHRLGQRPGQSSTHRIPCLNTHRALFIQ